MTAPRLTIPAPPVVIPAVIPKVTLNLQRPVVPTVIAPRVPTVITPKIVIPTPPRATVISVPQATVIPTPVVIAPRVLSPAVIPAPRVSTPNRITVPTPTRVNVPVTPNARTPVQTQARVSFTPEMIDDDTVIDLANTLDQTNFTILLQFLGDYYHNDSSLLSDQRYDELIAIYEAKFGRYTIVGALPRGEMVDLPYYAGSLRKVKEEAELNNWLANYPGPYLIEDKIDGATVVINSTVVNGRRVTKGYSRGGGTHGRDVTHVLPYLPIPQLNTDIGVRGEVVMTKAAFTRIGAGYKNPRNLVSGTLGAKEQFDPNRAREFSFYAYRIMTKNQSAEDDIHELKELGFEVPNPVAATTLTWEILENYFDMRKKEAPYEVDGLVIYQNRIGEYPVGDEPRHVVAFKTGTPTAITTVRDVVWRSSKDRKLKPRVYYDTTALSGADLNYASGYNARFIVNNAIGPGARILLTRSGDVIPKILSVISPSPTGPLVPDPNVHGSYNWNENQVEFIAEQDNNEVYIGRIKHFLTTLGVKQTGRKRIAMLVEAGITNVSALLRVTPQELAGIPGIGPGISNQLYEDVHVAVTNVNLATIADASSIFPNIGERRFRDVIAVHPNLLEFVNYPLVDSTALLREVRGINKLADEIMTHLPAFVSWLRDNPAITLERPPVTQPVIPAVIPFPPFGGPKPITLQLRGPQGVVQTPQVILQTPQVTLQTPQTPQPIARNLAGMTFVFSGFRDKGLEQRINNAGGRVAGSVSGNTTMLILKDLSPESIKGKGAEAQKRGVQLIARADFEQRYL